MIVTVTGPGYVSHKIPSCYYHIVVMPKCINACDDFHDFKNDVVKSEKPFIWHLY